MSGVLLFFISFVLVIASSYFLAGLTKAKRFENSVIYFVLILVSQVVISVDILSLFGHITQNGLIFLNALVLLVSYRNWEDKGKPHFDFGGIKITANKIVYSLKRDKVLLVLAGFFVFASLISLFYTLIVPTNNLDSLQYHLSRIGFWIQNKSLAHFETTDVRQIIYAINSEILILWSMLFIKRDLFAYMLQYWSYLGCIFLIYAYLSYFKISMRRILWAILIMASLPAVIVESSTTQTNIFVAFLLFCSFYLYIYGIKENDKTALIFSAIAFSFDLGVKYSVFFFVPVFGLIYLMISIREKGREFYKPALIFIGAASAAFLILSSYNYILNYMEFGNFLGSEPYLKRLSAPYGIRTFVANLIRYNLLFIDFSGMKFMEGFAPLYLQFKDFLFNIFGLQRTDGLVFAEIYKLNTYIHENHTRFGILGFLLFVPMMLKYSFLSFKKAGDKKYYTSITSLITLFFIFAMSVLMGFCIWNGRFLVTPVIISSTIFIFCYQRKLTVLKGLISLVVIFNYIVIPVFGISRPLMGIFEYLSKYDFINFRQEIRFRHEDSFSDDYGQMYNIIRYLGKVAPDNSKIGFFFGTTDIYYPWFEENPTWELHQLRYDKFMHKKNYNDYDYIVFSNNIQLSEIVDYKDIKYNYYIGEKGRVFPINKNEKLSVLYLGRQMKVLTSGYPYQQYNIINLKEVPPNFELIRTFKTIEEPNELFKNYDVKLTYIYKKM